MNEFRSITQLARELRKNQTLYEAILWQEIRNRKMKGLKFLRQHPIIYGNDNQGRSLFFIADFYCAEKKFVPELDGKIHDFQRDMMKTVLKFWKRWDYVLCVSKTMSWLIW
jgi:very-short-patch-repair endonuclease